MTHMQRHILFMLHDFVTPFPVPDARHPSVTPPKYFTAVSIPQWLNLFNLSFLPVFHDFRTRAKRQSQPKAGRFALDFRFKILTARGLQSVPCEFLGDWPRHGWAQRWWLQLCGIGGHFSTDAATFVATQSEVEMAHDLF